MNEVIAGKRGDLQCIRQIVGALAPRRVRVEEREPDPFAAVDQAAERLTRSIDRALENERG